MLQVTMAPKIHCLILLLGISISVGHAKLPNRIVKGDHASHTPYQVSLFIGRQHHCGGSIIDKRHIITAAHCLVSQKTGKITVPDILIGTNDQTNKNPNNVYSVIKTFVHEGYAPKDVWRNDIAILKVNRNIIFNQLQSPVSLPVSDTGVGTLLTLTGWGETQDPQPGAEKLPRYLRTISEIVLSPKECQKMMNTIKLKEGQICAWTGGRGGGCKYDSGGPLVDGTVLVGIVSFGDKSCSSQVPNVFTRVYHYVPWIRAVVAQSYASST